MSKAWVVADELWKLIEPVLPPWPAKAPGPRPVPDRLCLQGVLFVLRVLKETPPQHVEYELTALGKTLQEPARRHLRLGNGASRLNGSAPDRPGYGCPARSG